MTVKRGRTKRRNTQYTATLDIESEFRAKEAGSKIESATVRASTLAEPIFKESS